MYLNEGELCKLKNQGSKSLVVVNKNKTFWFSENNASTN